ncbi:MAG: LysM peptidoglycan-binding domain-containing protein [Peptostreptococcaceae bacterium]|nr:LysM peptidoglycan-binding domain-containing protein [Peptostreptococcaceae bacterium]
MPLTASAHCDTMDGPTVADGYKALMNNNVNYALKWVQPAHEEEIMDKFNLSMKVKDLSPEAKELSEQYFFSELVRVHRAGEAAPFDGLKPSGTPIDEKVLAADESIEAGNLSPLEGMIEVEKMPELTERFENLMGLKNYDVNNLEEGREYIEAYVKSFKFAEGEEEGHHAAVVDAHGAEAEHSTEADVDADAVHSEGNYAVKSGDTLSEIALKYHTTYQDIAQLKNIANPHLIYLGQTFEIPIK